MKITFESSKYFSGLLEELQEYFPNDIPSNLSVTIEDIRRLQGQQEVVQYIRNLLDDDKDE